MKHLYSYTKTIIALVFAITGCMQAYAYSFEVNGIYYKTLNHTNNTAVEVSYKGASYNSYDNEYSGTVIIPNSVYYNGKFYPVIRIGGGAFRNCSSLTSLTIPSSVTEILSNAFYGCTGLTKLTIEDGTEGLSLQSSSAYDCPLETLYLGRSISCDNPPFYSKLKSVTISNSVTRIGNNAFNGCYRLTEVSIPNSVTRIGNNAFYGCSGLTEITIPNSVTSLGDYAFYGCSRPTSVTIPNSVTEIGEAAFANCIGLTEVNISDLSAWCKISFSRYSNPLQYAHKLNLNGSEIKNLVIPNDITEIKRYAFNGCSGLTSVTIHNSVTTIEGCAFEDCDGLTSITIPNSVTEIGWSAFRDCDGLTSITIPNSVTKIGGYAFEDCTGLTEVTIPNSVTEIGDYAFRNCTGLTEVTIPNSVTKIGSSAFSNCTGLTEVTIPNSVTEIGRTAFSNCTGLTEVNYNAENCTSMGSTNSEVFSSCSNLKTLYIGNGVKIIPLRAFSKCDGLTSVTIPNSVTSIRADAFNGCSGLTSITIPNSVTEIGADAFNGCSLDSVTSYCMTPPLCYSDAFYGSYSALLKVPEGTKDTYATAPEWEKFKNIQEIAGVEDVMIDNVAVKIAIENDNISIIGIENPQIEIYNLNGKCLYSGNNTSIPMSSTGVYILRINGKSYKIVNN